MDMTTSSTPTRAEGKWHSRWPRRAVLRWLFSLLLVPAALAGVVWCGYGGVVRMIDLVLGLPDMGYQVTELSIPRLPNQMPLLRRWYVMMERLEPRGEDEQYYQYYRRCWQAHPQDNRYLGYYATQLSRGAFPFPQSQADLRLCLRRDPENAHAYYLLAYTDLQMAVKPGYGKTVNPLTGTRRTFTIVDRKRLDAAMRQFQQGLARPHLRRYHEVMLAKRLSQVPPDRTEEYLLRKGLVNGEIQQELRCYRELLEFCPTYAHLLISERRTAEAMPYLEAWRRFAVQFAGDAWTPGDIEYVRELSARQASISANLYTSLGMRQEAAEARVIAGRLNAKHPGGYPGVAGRHGTGDLLAMHAGVIPRIRWIGTEELLTRAPQPLVTPALFTPLRVLDYMLFEQLALAVLLVVLGVALLALLWAALSWRLELRTVTEPPVAFGWRLPAVVLASALLPLVLYLVYTRGTSWAGREYSLTQHLPRTTVEVGVVLLLLSLLPAVVSLALLHRRCRAQQVPVPPFRQIARRGVTSGLMLLGFFCSVAWQGLAWNGTLGEWGWQALPALNNSMPVIITVTGLFMLGGQLAVLVYLAIRQFRRPPEAYARYYAARAYALTLATTLTILLALAAVPALAQAERRCLRQDTLVFPRPGGSGLSVVEERLFTAQRTQFLAILHGTWPQDAAPMYEWINPGYL